MGKVRSKSGEGLSGLVGNVVFYSYKGETYVRSRPRKKSKNSWSERQLLAQKRFAALKAFWGRFNNSPIQEIWRVADENVRGDNHFLRTNKVAFSPDGTLTDPERLHLTAGSLPLPGKLTAVRSAADPSILEVTWQDDPGSAIAWDDDEMMMMVGHDGEFTGPLATGALREQEAAVIQLPAVSGTVQGIYLFFASEERKMYSGDVYFGMC
jgi:hypothetical protein